VFDDRDRIFRGEDAREEDKIGTVDASLRNWCVNLW
jgi:hypothetical protein